MLVWQYQIWLDCNINESNIVHPILSILPWKQRSRSMWVKVTHDMLHFKFKKNIELHKSTPIHSISFTMEIRNCPKFDYLTLIIKGQGHKKGHEVMHYFFISYYQPLANIKTLNRKSLLNRSICLFNIWETISKKIVKKW